MKAFSMFNLILSWRSVVSLVICNNMPSSDMCGRTQDMSISNWKAHLLEKNSSFYC